MLSKLGASLSNDDMRPYFPHPCESGEKVYVMLDVCHMLKLVRNTCAQKGLLFDGKGNKISWQYVEKLHLSQENEGLRLANKLRKRHLQCFKLIKKRK